MEIKEHQLQILELLKGHEMGASELYAAYANKFPEHDKLWSGLSKEELDHADWVEKLTEMVRGGTVYFNEGRFNPEALKNSLVELQNEIMKAKSGGLLLINALSTAYYFETALIERKFFEVFEGDSKELKHTLISLSDSTKKHQEIVKEALEREKNN